MEKVIMKLEKKHVLAYLDGGLKGMESENSPLYYLYSVSNDKFLWKPFYEKGNIKGRLLDRIDCKPILRHISDLTKPITHNGETFVPLDRIKELFIYNPRKCCEAYEKAFKEIYFDFTYQDFEEKIMMLPCEWVDYFKSIFIDLYKLIPNNLAVPVTNEFNPYK